MSWLRRSSFLLFALSASAVAGCSDDGGNQGPRPDAGIGGDATPGPDAPSSFVAKAEAHWVTRTTIAVPATMPGARFELHHAPDGGIGLDAGDLAGSTALTLTVDAAGLPAAVTTKFPHLTGYKALTLAAADAAQASEILKGQLVLAARDMGGDLLAATSVQIPGVLDDIYAAATGTLDTALGVTFEDAAAAKKPTFRLWAPTARKVTLKVYAAADKAETASEVMTRDDATGVWSYAAADDAWYGSYYRYEVEVFAPRANPGDMTTAPGELVVNLVTDPYSLGLSTNSEHSLIVNLDDTATKPTGWDAFTPPDNFETPEDIVLYEVHVRDFSIADETVTDAAHRGKYLAFTYNGAGPRPLSDGMAHLERLASVAVPGIAGTTLQGVTHVHVLPVFDIATINEVASERIDIDVAASVDALCQRLDDVVPGVSCTADTGKTIRQVLETLLDQSGEGQGTRGDTTEIQALVDATRSYDGYNWGYDPFHYTAPEGSYATNPEGLSRILELRAMVMGLGAINLRTVMDVVYNHTNASGQDDKSVLDKIVPGYYHRQNAETGSVERSTCCENTASEHAMMEKLMLDSVVTWVEQYKIAGFRFDLMAHHMKSNMLKVRDRLKEIDGKLYVYGEGWDFGEVVSGSRGENATQENLAGTEIATFSDRLRDGVRGGGPFDSGADLRKNQGFINGMFYDPNEANTDSADVRKGKLFDQTDLVSLGLAANLKDFVLTRKDDTNVVGADVSYNGYDAGYTLDPADVITYVAAHDNQTLFDNNQYKLPTATTMEDRVRTQVLGLGITVLAQGIPFLHMGEDILRSKSMARDSYDYGDWFNKVDFSYLATGSTATNNWNVGLPPQEKDGDAYPVIRGVIGNALIDPKAADMALAHALTRELLFIRRESPLFRLRTGDDVKTRVDFHNVGASQVPGLIVMTVTDGTCAGAEDLDATKDNVAVFINATKDSLTFPAAGTRLEGKSWILHRALEDGSDPRRSQMRFTSNAFEVPGRSIAVFLDLQSGATRDAGICNTKVAEDVQPPGGDLSKDVFIRGTFTDWAPLPSHKFTKVAEGRYEIVVANLAAGAHQFKVADDSWSTYNWGGSPGNTSLAPGGNLTLGSNGSDITLTIATAGDYKFVLDTMNLEEPVLSLEAQ